MLREIPILVPVLFLLALGGCAESGAPVALGYGDELAAAARPLNVDHEAVLVFQGDWSTVLSHSPVMAGGTLRVDYVAERLPACRATYNGMPAWGITMYYKTLPDETVQAAGMSHAGGLMRTVLDVPESATALEMWFASSDRYGCNEVDSAFGANYHVQVATPSVPATVTFTHDWEERADGTIRQGGLLRVDYAPERLRACRATYAGGRTWNIFASYRFSPGGQSDTVALFEGNYFAGEDGILQPDIPVPADATGVELWFSNNDRAGCTAWDSNFGENYRFAVGPGGDQAAAVGWAGDWGGYFGHDCHYAGDLADPITFRKSGLGHDCMAITADVWVAGLTDANGSPSAILARVETDIGFSGGPLAVPATYPLAFDGCHGNNFRFKWELSEHVGRADRGDYAYRFRFSADGGARWHEIGDRTLRVRNDSIDNDGETTETCADIERWDGATNHNPGCIDYTIAESYDATHCEFYVNALGQGSFSHGQTWGGWLEVYIRVLAVDGDVLNAGQWTRYRSPEGDEGTAYSLGSEIEPDYWLTGFTYEQNAAFWTPDGAPARDLEVVAFAFFLDVQRANGEVVRLWQSNGGANYTLEEVYAVEGYHHGIGIGSIEYADESAGLFDPKRACR